MIGISQLENVSLYALDVTDEASVANATRQILSDFGDEGLKRFWEVSEQLTGLTYDFAAREQTVYELIR